MKDKDLGQLAENFARFVIQITDPNKVLSPKSDLIHSAKNCSPSQIAKGFIDDKLRTCQILLEAYQIDKADYQGEIKKVKEEIKKIKRSYSALVEKIQKSREKAYAYHVKYFTVA